MNVQNALWELLYEPGRKQTHVSGEADEIDMVLFKGLDNFTVMLLTFFAFGRNRQCGQAETSSRFETAGVRLV